MQFKSFKYHFYVKKTLAIMGIYTYKRLISKPDSGLTNTIKKNKKPEQPIGLSGSISYKDLL